jgi:hypothetical protein
MTDDAAPGAGDLGGGEELDDAMLAEMRESYNVPPDPPLDAMWGRIEQKRREARAASDEVPRAPSQYQIGRK